MGIIARDYGGAVITMRRGSRLHISDPAMAEALAAREAVELGRTLGRRNIILEGDALEVVNALLKDDVCMGQQGQIINDAKSLMNCGIQWKIQHVRREGNGAAHILAKVGLQHEESQIWSSDFPECMNDVILAEQDLVFI